MDRVHIPRHRGEGRIPQGHWYVATDGDLWLRCPMCGKGAVMEEHSVNAAGEVTPSIMCARTPQCSYHVWGILDGWFYGEKPEGAKVKFTDQTCPDHVASESDPKICGRCGIHIDSLR